MDEEILLEKRKELLDKLFSLGLLKVNSIAELIKASSENGRDVIEEAIVSGRISPDALPYIFAEHLDIPFMVLQKGDVDSSLATYLPSEIAWGEDVVPLSVSDDFLTVGVYNPLRPYVFRRIEKKAGKKVRIALVSKNSISEILMHLYPPPVYLSEKKLSGDLAGEINFSKFFAMKDSSSLVSEIFYLARISGVNVLTFHFILGKFIVDGRKDTKSTVLLEAGIEIGEFIFSGLKKLCGPIDEKVAIHEHIVEVGGWKRQGMYKIAIVSGAGSKKAVIRVIPNALGKLSIEYLGFNDEQLELITRMIKREKGIYIIASPTYDGVTTTLYSMVRYAQRPNSRVVAIEEDIRFKNEGFVQIEKHMIGEDESIEKIIRNLSPDILMYDDLSLERLVDEVIHTTSSQVSIFAGTKCNSLEFALEKVINSRISPYVLASSLKAIVFQKLVKKLCMACKKDLPTIPSSYLPPELVESGKGHFLRKVKYFIPTGCEECNGTGFSAKTALFDVITFTPSVRMEILMDKPHEEKREKILSHVRLGPEETVIDMLTDGEISFEDAIPFLKSFVKRNK